MFIAARSAEFRPNRARQSMPEGVKQYEKNLQIPIHTQPASDISICGRIGRREFPFHHNQSEQKERQ